jgi:beta-phosphoglucomutase
MLPTMKAALFDLDGVIVDTAKYHFLAWKRLADELGSPFGERENMRLKGVGRMRCMDIILELGGLTMTEAEKERHAARKNAWYVEYIRAMGRDELLPGAEAYLEHLRSRGTGIALGSASRNAPLILERLGIGGLFDAVIDGTKVSRSKPDPEVFLAGAAALGVPPGSCSVFEDSAAGIEAAKRGGMYAIGIGERDELPLADMVVRGLHELAPPSSMAATFSCGTLRRSS